MKLSKVQTELIKQLQAKAVCHYESGLEGRCYILDKNISWATIFRLEDLKLIERKGDKVILTKLGKKYESKY
jgi:uncharacterized protein YlaN (UPF0358 family)